MANWVKRNCDKHFIPCHAVGRKVLGSNLGAVKEDFSPWNFPYILSPCNLWPVRYYSTESWVRYIPIKGSRVRPEPFKKHFIPSLHLFIYLLHEHCRSEVVVFDSRGHFMHGWSDVRVGPTFLVYILFLMATLFWSYSLKRRQRPTSSTFLSLDYSRGHLFDLKSLD